VGVDSGVGSPPANADSIPAPNIVPKTAIAASISAPPSAVNLFTFTSFLLNQALPARNVELRLGHTDHLNQQ
jgi:hypothetical protein